MSNLLSAGDLSQAAPRAHAFFSIYELCKQLAISLDGDLGDLFSLACVSRALSDVALDELWSEIDDIRYLVALLPPDAYQINDEDNDSDDDDDYIVSTYHNPLPVPWLITSSFRL